MKVDYQDLLSNISDGVYFTDTDRRIIYWNAGAGRITGFSAEDVAGIRCSDNILVHINDEGCSLCRSLCPLAAAMKDGTPREASIYVHHKQGHRIPVHVRTTPLHDSNGKLIGGAEFFTDISHQEILAERLREMENLALLDALTGLPNRHHLIPELHLRFEEKLRLKLDFGLVFIDVDKFKRINDTFGHAGGDLVLKTVANTMKAFVRPFDLVGRWGGDEFVCIVRNANERILQTMAHRLLTLLNASSLFLDNHPIHIAVSVGITMCNKEDNDTTLIQRADALMYKSKQNGGNQVTLG